MMYLMILISVGVQVLLYILFRRQKYTRLFILLLFLFFNFYLFPLLVSESLYSGPEPPRCGMASIGIFFFFWVIGGGLTLLTHLSCWLYDRRLSAKRRATDQDLC